MDRTKAVLSQYDISCVRTRKGRGVLLLDTQEGLYQLKEYTGPKERIEVQFQLSNLFADSKEWMMEQILPNKEGCVYTVDQDKSVYLVLQVIEGKECDPSNEAECMKAVGALKKLHEKMYLPEYGNQSAYHIKQEIEKHQKDLTRARKFIRSRPHKSEFELELCRLYEHFMEQVGRALELSEDEAIVSYEEEEARKGSICHGDCQYHNVVINGDKVGFCSLEKWCYDTHIRDFYRFFRKIMEKNHWNWELGKRMIRQYFGTEALTGPEGKLFFSRLFFPEKYWKIINYYMNSRKSYISERNIEKCRAQVEMESMRLDFLEKLSIDIYGKEAYNKSRRNTE